MNSHLVIALVCLIVLATTLRAHQVRKDSDTVLLWAIAEKETGNNPRARGPLGEFTAYQFRWKTWSQYTTATAAVARITPGLADQVARLHLKWLRDTLKRNGVSPTPENLALAWHAGATAVIHNQLKLSQRVYGEHVMNLYKEAMR